MSDKELGGRLKAAREQLGLSISAMAQKLGMSHRGYQDNESGRTIPKSTVLVTLVDMGFNSHWLITGEGPMMIEDSSGERQKQQKDMLLAVLDGDPEAQERRETRRQQFTGQVQRLRGALAKLPPAQAQLWEAHLHQAAADGKASLEDLLGLLSASPAPEPGVIWVPVHPLQQAEGRQAQPYSRQALAARNLDPARLAICYSPGNAMEPTIRDGDPLLVNLAGTRPQDGGLFMVQLGEDLYAKRIQCLVDGGLVLISDNREYQPQTIPANRADQLPIIGQVVSIDKTV